MNTEIKTSFLPDQPDERVIYKPIFDVMQLFCILLFVLCSFTTPFPFVTFTQIFLGFGPCVLFTMFGFMVLRDGEDLKPHVIRMAKTFCFLFVVYTILTAGYSTLTTGQPLSFVTLGSTIYFLLLNIWWGGSFCGNIWIVQSALYGLVILWLLRKYKKFDWVLCIVLFWLGAVFGDFSVLLGMPIYFSGNFLTRAIPYMLLGRLLYRGYRVIPKFFHRYPFFLSLIGWLLAMTEFIGLLFIGKLGYYNHLLGFIPVAAGFCLYCFKHDFHGTMNWLSPHASFCSKWVFCLFSPLIGLITLFLPKGGKDEVLLLDVYGLVVLVVLLLISFGLSVLLRFRRVPQSGKQDNEKEAEEEDDDE